MKAFIVFILSMACLIHSPYAFSYLGFYTWEWFVEPLFHWQPTQLDILGLLLAAGVARMYVFGNPVRWAEVIAEAKLDSDEKNEVYILRLLGLLLSPWLGLGVVSIYHYWVFPHFGG